MQHLLPRTTHVSGIDGQEHHVVLFERSLREEQVVDREDSRHGIAQDLGTNVLRSEESGIKC